MADVLGGFFRCRFLRRHLFVLGRLQTLKIELPPRREHDFYKIDVFKNGWENCGFCMRFGKSKRWRINKNMQNFVSVFLTPNFERLLSILAAFREVGTPQHGPILVPTSHIRFLFSWFWGGLEPRKVTRDDFGKLLGRFGMDYGMLERILKRFRIDFWNIRSLKRCIFEKTYEKRRFFDNFHKREI